jgi:hypothetical protein
MKRAGLPWFRFYANWIDDLRLARLSDGQYRIWSGLMCLTSEYGGALPHQDVIAFRLRKSEKTIADALSKLIDAGLIEKTAEGLRPQNWSELQYKSDSSTERVRALRERKRNVSPAVTETAPERETESDTETEGERDQSALPLDRTNSKSSSWPKGFTLTPQHISFAKANGFTPEHAQIMFNQFRDHHLSHGNTRNDWDAAFRYWVGQQVQRGGSSSLVPVQSHNFL